MTKCRAVGITPGEAGTSYRKRCGLREQLDELLRKARILEEAARQNEQRSRLIIESGLDAVVITDDQGFITCWNGQAEKTFGWSREEALDRRLTEAILPTRYWMAPPEGGLGNFLHSGNKAALSRRIEITALHREGHEFPVELAISSAVVEAEWMFIVFARDISEPRRVEEMLRHSEEQVRSLLKHHCCGHLGS
jgi:sigma-B regulation protein RsbU (phosphoserine phosphatase)